MRRGAALRPVIGILSYRVNKKFMDSRFLKDLVIEGEKLGAHVFAFSHVDLLEKSRKIRGFVPDGKGGWVERICPWPDVVIDFCRKLYKPFRDMRRRKDLFPYANHKFTYKWKAMKLFASSEEVNRWIPKTSLYTEKQLERMLEAYPIVYIKPGNGTGGHSIVKIKRVANEYHLYGRRKSGLLVKEKTASKTSLTKWVNRWVRIEQIRSGRFMIQQGLDLELLPGRLVDARLFIQKNGQGEWEVTGKVLRVGGKNSPTTNLLYGDGKALGFEQFLAKRFGEGNGRAISKECDQMALHLVNVIERRFGSMIEFGLDVGIDTEVRVWLIEVNPKPSHNALLEVKDVKTYRRSIQLPILYAKYVALQERVKADMPDTDLAPAAD
jgi:hypothetical protein